MPCFGPLTLREQFEVVRRCARWRRTCRVGALALLGYLVVRPSGLHGEEVAAPVEALALGQCQTESGVADLGVDDAMLSAGKLPEKFPDFWRKPPCPKGKGLTKERGACFLVLDAKPPCDIGYDDSKGRCLYPIAERKDAPRSISQ